MKREFRIPTDQFAYINLELADNEALTEGSIQEAIQDYKRATEAYKRSGEVSGVPTSEFNKALDEYMLTSQVKGGTELYNRMSPAQQSVFQEVKKSLKRINAAEGRTINVAHND